MSDSEGSDASATGLSDPILAQALRSAIKDVFKSGQLENLTVRRIRKATEEQLGLEDDFFKHDSKWSAKSKQVIEEEAEAQHALRDEVGDATPSPTAKKPVARRKQASKGNAKREPSRPKAKALPTTRGTKRSPLEVASRGRKRQKLDNSPSASELSELSESSPMVKLDKVPRKPAKSKSNRPKKSTVEAVSESEEEAEDTDGFEQQEVTESVVPPVPKKVGSDAGAVEVTGSESEMSVLIDEEPAPKKKRRKSSTGPVGKKASKAKSEGPSKSKDDASLDPQQAEIKRLQSWLLKCGIRKMWHKELAPFETQKAKIGHLKEMLADAGMDGRYSAEKAKQIKEAREFKADLEAVQEGAKKWGQSGGSENSGTEEEKPKRRLARGLKELDFLSDSGGEETD
ncbi:MAG: hypothetical protein M1812_000959 [Candelaria pacifica]|nr:MAG: hypothetical protein M1812_000959 [Candelaria pacifica]